MIAEVQKSRILKPLSFSYEEVLKSSLEYFSGDELAATTWINKYAMKNKQGKLVENSPDDMHSEEKSWNTKRM